MQKVLSKTDFVNIIVQKGVLVAGVVFGLVLILGELAIAQVCVQPPAGLISWWDAASVSGTTALDIQDGNNGDMVNVGIVQSEGRNAFSFDGFDSYIEVPDSPNQKPASITVAGWFNFNSAPAGEFFLVSKYDPPGVYIGWILRIGSDLRPAFSVTRQLTPYPLTGIATYTLSSDAVPLQTWVHIAGTYDATTGAVGIYVNGMLTGTDTFSGGYSPPSTPMRIGTATHAYGEFMDGLADAVGLYDHALSASEVQAIFNAGRALCQLPPAVATALSAAGIESAALPAEILEALVAADAAGLLYVVQPGTVVPHNVVLQPGAVWVLGSGAQAKGSLTGDASTTVIVGTGADLKGSVKNVGNLVYADGQKTGDLQHVGTVTALAGAAVTMKGTVTADSLVLEAGSNVVSKGNLQFSSSLVMSANASLTVNGNLTCATGATASVDASATVRGGTIRCVALLP